MCGQAIEVPDWTLKGTRRVSNWDFVAITSSVDDAIILAPGAVISGYEYNSDLSIYVSLKWVLKEWKSLD